MRFKYTVEAARDADKAKNGHNAKLSRRQVHPSGQNVMHGTCGFHAHRRQPLHVSVFAFDGISPFFLTFPLRVFREVQALAPNPPVELDIFGLARGPIRLEAIDPLTLELRHDLQVLTEADIVIIPSWHGVDVPVPSALVAALRLAYARGALVVGLCLGVFVLGRCGLLDHRAATTTETFAHAFSLHFPLAYLNPGVLYVCQDRVMTSAGRASAMDCCLALVEEFFGLELADRIANNLVSPPARYGEHAQAVPARASLSGPDRRVLQLMDWMKSRLREPLRVATLAARANMTPRTLARHFRQMVGATPKAWLTAQRLAYAQTLLEHSRIPIDAIALATGFESTAALRKQFRLTHGVGLRAYRHAHAPTAGACLPG